MPTSKYDPNDPMNEVLRAMMTPQQRLEYDQRQQKTQELIDAIFQRSKDPVGDLISEIESKPARIEVNYHVKVRADGGVSAICPTCNKRKRCLEQMLTWVLWCKGCGYTGTAADKPAVSCDCEECRE
jgi:hypothetical protein